MRWGCWRHLSTGITARHCAAMQSVRNAVWHVPHLTLTLSAPKGGEGNDCEAGWSRP